VSPRDISGRVLGKPLRSPYAPGGGNGRARWLWVLPAAWVIYACLFSDHSLLRLFQLRSELSNAKVELRRVRSETAALGARLADPRERAEHAEAMLRAQGMARPGEVVYRFGGTRADSMAGPAH